MAIMATRSNAIRPVVESVTPELSCGRFAIKRVVGDVVTVQSIVLLDGHDLLSVRLRVRHESDRDWQVAPMRLVNPGRDTWEASFAAEKIGRYFYTVEASVDYFRTWEHEIQKKHEAGQEISVELKMGIPLLKAAIGRARGTEKKILSKALTTLLNAKTSDSKKVQAMLAPQLKAVMQNFPDQERVSRYSRELSCVVDPERAVFSAWYEFFPRSTSGAPGKHSTFKDCERMLPYVSEMGFDIIYLPPIHPIGAAFRKGRNNSLTPAPNDPGSPWGIGSAKGGHKSIHPELGSLADFKRFTAKAKRLGIEIALDIAFQCSPDHPYVKSHPEWFKKRPDGTIQYAENPPKKYQDIYPFHFETPAWKELWKELKSVVEFWIRQGITVFRVDNPHTKPFPFWEWLITEVKRQHPEVIFLSEAFTRPNVMYHLAKIGFSQSYTYFTWRNTPEEFKQYLEELTHTEVSEFFRPNFWPNTPDILPFHLQGAGAAVFKTRLALAATLSSNYGIYGPAYELGENRRFKEGGEEYADSEKYEIKAWDLKAKRNISVFITKLNQIRKNNPALQRTGNIEFLETGNPLVLAFVKGAAESGNRVLVVANLDFAHAHFAQLKLPGSPRNLRDLLAGKNTLTRSGTLSIQLHPERNPVHIFGLEGAQK